jgi:putative spermidine/putrescine transport system substrate-binding protein
MNSFAMRRRTLMRLAAATSVAGLLPMRGLASESFVVAAYGGPFEETLRNQILPDFDRENGVSTALELGAGGRFLQQMFMSRARSPFDVVYLNHDEALIGDQADLLEPIDPEKCPNIEEIHDIARPPSVHLYSTSVYELGLTYNHNLMDPPRTWEDLWDQDIVVGVPHAILSYGMMFLLVAARLNGGDEANIDRGFEQIKKLPNFRIYRGFVEAMEMFRSGEIHASLFFKNRAVQMAAQGMPISFTAPEGGNFGMISGCRVPKNARNPELGHIWANLSMSREWQEIFVPGLYSPSNRMVVLPEEVARDHIYGEEAVSSLILPDWATMNEIKSQIYEQWDREFT